METSPNTTDRYKIQDIPITGIIYSMEDVIPYKTGTGCFRNILVETVGKFNDTVYVPITVFGADAKELDPVLDRGRRIDVTVCLTTRQYEWNGKTRWNVSLPSVLAQFGPRAVPQPKPDEQEQMAVTYGDPNIPDDIPF